MLHSSYGCVYKQGQYVDQANGIILGTADTKPIYVLKAAKKGAYFQVFVNEQRYHEKDPWF